MIASVLVGQNPHAAPGAKQVDHGLEAVFAIKEFQSCLTAGAPNVRVDKAVAESLIDAGIPYVADELRHKLGKQFPDSEMAQHQHDGYAGAKSAVHRLDVFDRDSPQDFLRRHLHELCAGKQISAQAPKMTAHKAAQFPG